MKLSIISVNLNNRDGLQDTIESVINQTFSDYEYIIIDGGSTDGSADIIKQHEGKITYWVSEPDKGIYNAMNKGILQARGEYCLFLNSGDYLLSEHVLEKALQNPINEDFLLCRIQGQGKNKGLIPFGKEITFYDLFVASLPHGATFIKKDLFNSESFGLYDEDFRLVSDWFFFVRAFVKGISYRYVDVDFYANQKNGASSQLFELAMNERKTIIQQYYSLFQKDYEELNHYKSSRIMQKFYKLLRHMLKYK